MFNFFYKRKPALLNFSILAMFIAIWSASYMWQPLKGLIADDEFLFYGTVSHAAIPSIFGGSNIPFFDKTFFQLNGDDHATFILYASEQMLNDMSSWYSFAAQNASEIPLEISAVRVSANTFVVHSISTNEGELDFDDLVIDYQVYYAFIGCILVLATMLLSLILFIIWLVKVRKI